MAHTDSTFMNDAAMTLKKARENIIKYRKAITEKMLKLSAEIEMLADQMPLADIRDFLVTRCDLSDREVSMYVKVAKNLSGFFDVLQENATSYEVIKGLASANSAVRSIGIAKITSGMRFDTSDITATRREVAHRKLSPEMAMANARKRAMARAVQSRTEESVANLRSGTVELMEKVASLREGSSKAGADTVQVITSEAERLRPIFETFWGTSHPRPGDAAWRELKPFEALTAKAHRALTFLAVPAAKTGADRSKQEANLLKNRGSLLHNLANFVGEQDFTNRILHPKKQTLKALPKKRLKVLELCAGAGGMALGLEAAGFEHLALVEFNKDAAATMRRNRPLWPVVEKDMTTIDFTQYAGKVDLVCGGLPCQPYSEEGNGEGRNDSRDLLLEGARAVREIQPRAFLFENVRGALFGKHSDQIAAFLKELGQAGYEIQIVNVNTQDYGIAQNRPRMMFVGLRDKDSRYFEMPRAFPERRANVGDVLYDLMASSGWSGVDEWAEMCRTASFALQDGTVVQGAQASTLTGRNGKARERAAIRWGRNGLNPGGIPDEAPNNEYVERNGESAFRPGLTLRMRARLQDFVDDYVFVGSKDSIAKQIGNAVAPRLAQAMGLALYEVLEIVSFDMEALLWPREKSGESGERTQIDPPPLDTFPALEEAASAHHVEPAGKIFVR